MSALAEAFSYRTSATTNIKSNDEIYFISSFRLLNKVIDAICDVDLYESREELKPSACAIITAADALNHVSVQDVDSVEIEPYSGELSLIWKAGRNKRIKAMFGPEKNSYSVYFERMVDGRVVEH